MVKITPRIRKSTISDGYEIEFYRETQAGDRLGSHVLAEMSLQDLTNLRDVLDWFVTEGQYQ